MNIQNIQQFNNQQKPHFTGWLDAGLRFLDVNQAWGATGVDFTCMVAPRTITDFSRGTDAGIETARREATGTINHALIGCAYGTLAGMLLSSAINAHYGIKAHKIFADSAVIDILGKHRFDTMNLENSAAEYAKKVAESISDNGKFLSDAAKKNFAETLASDIASPSKDTAKLLKNIVLSDLGKETNLTLQAGEKKTVASLNDIASNITSLSKNLFKEKVTNSFKKAASFDSVEFLKTLKNFGMRRSLLGISIGAAIGCCIQPFNIYLTKRKTGSDGFVGVEGREKDKSKGFKALKTGVAAMFGAGVYSFITNHSWKKADFSKNVQFKGLTPTIPQFMFVYGLTIMSRFLAARDKDELREASVKDTLGFVTWLVLGNFVSKGVLKLLDKDLVGKTRDEVVYGALKKAGISTVKDNKALPFTKLIKLLPKADKTARLKLNKLNIAQLAGYAFSGIVLGRGIPKLNIYMTNKSEQKRARQRAMNPVNNMLKPENIAFLSNQMNFTAGKMLNER